MRNITFAENSFHNVDIHAESPLVMTHEEASAASTWVVDTGPAAAVRGVGATVESVLPEGRCGTAAAPVHADRPISRPAGPERDRVNLRWPQAVSGKVILRVRIDDAL